MMQLNDIIAMWKRDSKIDPAALTKERGRQKTRIDPKAQYRADQDMFHNTKFRSEKDSQAAYDKRGDWGKSKIKLPR